MYGSIVIVETNTHAAYPYHPLINVTKPNLPFNFNRYLNIGLNTSNAEWVGLCNNDLIFKRNWFTEILKAKQLDSEIKSFAPIDYDYWGTPKDRYQNKNEYYLGYNIRTEIPGWSIVAERDLFSKIGKLDEKFDFYYADNDYAMTLYKHQIKHALCLKSQVKHLGSKNSQELVSLQQHQGEKYEHKRSAAVPEYLMKDENRWITENPKMFEGYLKFHYKWGSEPSIRFRKKLIRRLQFLNVNIGWNLFASPINYILSVFLRMRNNLVRRIKDEGTNNLCSI